MALQATWESANRRPHQPRRESVAWRHWYRGPVPSGRQALSVALAGRFRLLFLYRSPEAPEDVSSSPQQTRGALLSR